MYLNVPRQVKQENKSLSNCSRSNLVPTNQTTSLLIVIGFAMFGRLDLYA
jgi:hypothetical protein